MSVESNRPADVIEQEIAELSAYLRGVPQALRTSGALKSYESRLANLEWELLVSALADLVSAEQRAKAGIDFRNLPPRDPRSLAFSLAVLEAHAERGVRSERHRQLALNLGVLVATMSGVVVSLAGSSLSTYFLLIASLAMLAKVVLEWRDRAVQSQRTADKLSSVQFYLDMAENEAVDIPIRVRYLTALLKSSRSEPEPSHSEAAA